MTMDASTIASGRGTGTVRLIVGIDSQDRHGDAHRARAGRQHAVVPMMETVAGR